MAFNFKGFFRFTYRWLLRPPWSPRRLLIIVAFLVLFPLIELVTWIGLGLDNVLFRKYRRQRVASPVFIVGNFRSGTTFLHRLLNRDEARFSTMAMWEILFAPSVLQRRIVEGLVAADRWAGGPVRRLLDRTEEGWQEQNVMHEVSLREPEEDDYLLLHIWSALTTGLSSGLLEEAEPYADFDTALPAAERQRIMGFHRRCVQRHLYAHRAGESAHYLAKNPALCPKLETLFDFFPDAKIVYLVRSPLEAIPSFLSMMQFSWRAVGVPAGDPALRDYILHMARHWYSYPLERLAQAPEDSYAIVNYEDLVRDPEQTVHQVYRRLGFQVGPAFSQVLREASAGAHRYTSRHAYSVEALGLNRRRILTEFRDVFERFGFDTGEPGAPPEHEKRVRRPAGAKAE